MQPVRTNPSGQLLKSEKLFYGGEFSFFEKLRSNRGGSPKVIYHFGIPSFDALEGVTSAEFTFANFELLRKGLIIHANANRRAACVGVRFEDCKSINLTGYKIQVLQKDEVKIIHRGVLEIKTQTSVSAFTVLPSIFQSINAYFGKGPLERKYTYTENQTPSEDGKQEAAWLRFLEVIDLLGDP